MLLVLAALSVAASEPTELYVVEDDWRYRPRHKEAAKLWPIRAADYLTEGYAVALCTVTAEGGLASCRSVAEAPPGEHFGAAAVKIASLFKIKPVTTQGRVTDGATVRVPIRFIVPESRWASAREDIIARTSACYGQVAHAAEQDLTKGDGWRASAYWTHQLAVAMASALRPPSDFEEALAESHKAAATGELKPPPGAELKTCLAQVPKK